MPPNTPSTAQATVKPILTPEQEALLKTAQAKQDLANQIHTHMENVRRTRENATVELQRALEALRATNQETRQAWLDFNKTLGYEAHSNYEHSMPW